MTQFMPFHFCLTFFIEIWVWQSRESVSALSSSSRFLSMTDEEPAGLSPTFAPPAVDGVRTCIASNRRRNSSTSLHAAYVSGKVHQVALDDVMGTCLVQP